MEYFLNLICENNIYSLIISTFKQGEIIKKSKSQSVCDKALNKWTNSDEFYVVKGGHVVRITPKPKVSDYIEFGGTLSDCQDYFNSYLARKELYNLKKAENKVYIENRRRNYRKENSYIDTVWFLVMKKDKSLVLSPKLVRGKILIAGPLRLLLKQIYLKEYRIKYIILNNKEVSICHIDYDKKYYICLYDKCPVNLDIENSIFYIKKDSDHRILIRENKIECDRIVETDFLGCLDIIYKKVFSRGGVI